MSSFIRPVLVAASLASLAVAPVAAAELAPAPFAEVLSEFQRTCVMNLTSKPDFLAAVKSSAWQFAADPSGTPMGQLVPDGTWASPKGKVSAVHGELKLQGIPPFQCTLSATLDALPDPAAVLPAAELALGLTGGKLRVGKVVTEIEWQPPVVAGEPKRKIFVQLGGYDRPKLAVRLTVMQSAGKK